MSSPLYYIGAILAAFCFISIVSSVLDKRLVILWLLGSYHSRERIWSGAMTVNGSYFHLGETDSTIQPVQCSGSALWLVGTTKLKEWSTQDDDYDSEMRCIVLFGIIERCKSVARRAPEMGTRGEQTNQNKVRRFHRLCSNLLVWLYCTRFGVNVFKIGFISERWTVANFGWLLGDIFRTDCIFKFSLHLRKIWSIMSKIDAIILSQITKLFNTSRTVWIDIFLVFKCTFVIHFENFQLYVQFCIERVSRLSSFKSYPWQEDQYTRRRGIKMQQQHRCRLARTERMGQ